MEGPSYEDHSPSEGEEVSPAVLPLTIVNVTAGVYAHALALSLGIDELPFVEVAIWAQLCANALACATHNARLAVLRSVRRAQHPAMPAELALVYLARSVHALALAIGLASRLCLPQERFIVAYWGDEERHCQMPGPKKDPAGPLSLVKTFF